MNYTNEQFNLILNKYKEFADQISNTYFYPENIRHLLYIIIPAFIIKYEIENERNITSTFQNIKIKINDIEDHSNPALYTRHLYKTEDFYQTKKEIIIKNYQNANYLSLLDSIIHEYNHAINSIKNEIMIMDEHIYLRTGLSYAKYDLSLHYLESINVTLEEIINTNQTEKIINIIKEFHKYTIENIEISNQVSLIEREISSSFQSKAYFLQSYVCQSLLNNTTFIHTLESLRFSGNVEDIENWFDNIVGKDKSFERLSNLLNDSLEKEKELGTTKFFKNRKIGIIKDNIDKILQIITIFNQNCNFK